MSVTIDNGTLSATIASMGSELKSLREHATGTEYIWQSDPAYWTGAAPVLFPICGGLRDGVYRFEGKTYKMGGHGIVRKKEWQPAGCTATSASFQTASNAETRQNYPFDFNLKTTFTLDGSSLAVRYDVTNTGRATMWFSIGSHPAFNVPFAGGYLEHYYVHFDQPENMERYFFADGCHLAHSEPAFDNSRQINLTPTLFDRGILIFKDPASKCFTLMSSQSSKRIRIRTEGVPFVALWAPPGAPFACVEPWHGVPDPIGTDGEFTTKEGIMSLAGGATYTTGYAIDILDDGVA